MAIAFRSKTTGFVVSGTSTSINVPVGVADGDLLFLMGTDEAAKSINTPSGWTALITQANQLGVKRLRVFYRVASSEPASYTITWSASTSAILSMLAYSGVDTTTPIDVSGSNNNAASASVTANSVTTTTDNGMLCGFFMVEVVSSSFTPPSGMTEQNDFTHIGSGSTFEEAELALGTHGATGSKVATAAGAGDNQAALIALKAAASGGTLLDGLMMAI